MLNKGYFKEYKPLQLYKPIYMRKMLSLYLVLYLMGIKSAPGNLDHSIKGGSGCNLLSDINIVGNGLIYILTAGPGNYQHGDTV